MKSFTIIGHEPLSVRLKKIFCIEELLLRGVKVEYWDLSQYFFPEIVIPDLIDDVFVVKFNDLFSVEKALRNCDLKNTVFAIEVFNSYNNISFFKMLTKVGCYCVKIDLYANTIIPVSKYTKFKRLFSLTNFDFKKIYFRFYHKFFQKKLYKQVLSSSSLSNFDIRINHPDYEMYIDDNQSILNEEYILFLDVYYPLHPDLKYFYKSKMTGAVDYQNLMNDFFEFIENKYSVKVIIAAHPKSTYQGDEFGGRLIIKNKTNTLVKHALHVISHESNTLSYISLSNKSFAFVYPNSYRKIKPLMNYLKALASYCSMPLYNLEKCDWNKIEFKTLKQNIRERYIYNFLTSEETENKRNVDIIFQLLK